MGLNSAITFTALRFQGVLASFFLNGLFLSTVVEGFGLQEAMSKALSNSFHLGPHSDVIIFEFPLPSPSQQPSPPLITKFVWWNSHHRPYGFSLPLVCPVCNAIRPWEENITLSEEEWATRCRNPSCGLRKDGSREKPGGKVLQKKPDIIDFVTPGRRKTNGWFTLDVSAEFL